MTTSPNPFAVHRHRSGSDRRHSSCGGGGRGRLRTLGASIGAVAVLCTCLVTGTGDRVQALPVPVPAPVGQGFTVLPSDLAFILKQIKIAEHHAATYSPAHPCDTLVGPGPDQIPDYLTSYGLRTVDGSCNNLVPGREKFAAADLPFPRLTTPDIRRRRADHAELSCRSARADELQAEERLGHRLAAACHQQPHRRPDVDQPGCRRCSRVPGQDPGQPRCVPVHHRADDSRRHRRSARRLRTRAPHPVHPERHHQRRTVTPVQQPVHVLRPVLRPRRRPDGEGRRHRVRSAPRRRPVDRRARPHPRHRRRPATPDAVHGPHSGPEPTRSRRHDGYGRRHPEREQHRLPLDRPEPDLHVTRGTPGVPSRVRAQRRRPPGLDGQAARPVARSR